MTAVAVSNLAVHHREDSPVAVRDVTFQLNAGECCLVTGPAGSGKTTVLLAVAGIIPRLYRPFAMAGEVRFVAPDGSTSRWDPMAATGVVLQNLDDQLLDLTVEDCIAFPLENRALPRLAVRKRVWNLLTGLHLDHLQGRRVRTLSGGEKRMVALAAALASCPWLLILDEPGAGLDPGARARLHSLLHDLKAQGQALLVAEQDASWIAGLVDQVVYLDPGGTLARVGRGHPQFPPLWSHLAPPEHRPGSVPSHLPLAELEGVVFAPGRGCPPALKGVSLRIFPGDVIALIGPNGAGKTSLLRAIMGLSRPQAGAIRLLGADAGALTVAQRARHVGYLFQQVSHMFFAPTVAAEVDFSAAGGRPAMPLLGRYGLVDRAGWSPFTLSFREMQRLGLACLSAASPKLILLDEPLIGGDRRWCQELARFVSECRSRGGAVILASHDLDLCRAIATRVVMLSQGEVVYDGDVASAWASPAYQDLGWPVPSSGLAPPSWHPGQC